MQSVTSPAFWKAHDKLPAVVRNRCKKQYRLWLTNPHHPSLSFKKIKSERGLDIYSARVSSDYRVLGAYSHQDKILIWFWIGKHAEYDTLLKHL